MENIALCSPGGPKASTEGTPKGLPETQFGSGSSLSPSPWCRDIHTNIGATASEWSENSGGHHMLHLLILMSCFRVGGSLCLQCRGVLWLWESWADRTWLAWAVKHPLEGSKIRVSGNTPSSDQDASRLSAKVDHLEG